jgi:uncharacterized membrane protein YbhN (UPF0104 family)
MVIGVRERVLAVFVGIIIFFLLWIDYLTGFSDGWSYWMGRNSIFFVIGIIAMILVYRKISPPDDVEKVR